jgi:hypothetical protein
MESIFFFACANILPMTPKKGIDLPKLLTLRLDEKMRRRIEELAREEQRTLGNMARLIMQLGLDALEKKKGKAGK